MLSEIKPGFTRNRAVWLNGLTGEQLIVNADDPTEVVSRYPSKDFATGRDKANADLDLAAPDLYAALVGALPILSNALEEPWRGAMPFEPEASKMRADLAQITAIRAALAKARGEAQP